MIQMAGPRRNLIANSSARYGMARNVPANGDAAVTDKPQSRIIESTVTHHPNGFTEHRLRYIDDAGEYRHYDITWGPRLITGLAGHRAALDSTTP
jgi:hypothetical protein